MVQNLLFINPSFFFLHDHHKDVYYHQFPNDLLQLSSFLKKKLDIVSDFIDLRFEEELSPVLSSQKLEKEFFRKKLLKVLENNSSQEFQNIIIFPGSSFEFLQTTMIAEIIKSEFSDSNLIVAAHHPTADFLHKNSPFDYVIEGEFEINALELLKSKILKKGNKPKQPCLINIKELVELDTLPLPDYELYLEKYPYRNHFKFELTMSKGCPFSCNFCRIWRSTSKMRNFSFNIFIERFNKLRKITEKYNSNPKISFLDQIFNSASISKKILNFIIQFNLHENFQFSCQSRIEIVHKYRELIELFRKTKMTVGFGIESANKEILTEMKKTRDPVGYIEKMKDILKIYKNINEIYCRINFIAGFPGENQKTFQDSIDFINNYALHENIQICPTLFFNDPITNVYSNMGYYEKKYGTEFLKEWWKIPSDPLKNSVLPKASKDLNIKELIGMYLENYFPVLKVFKLKPLLGILNWKKYFQTWYNQLE